MKKGGNPNPNMKGLKPAKKGEIRNPKGKPKGSLSLVTLLKKALEEDYFVFEKDEEGKFKKDEYGKFIIVQKMKKKDAVIIALVTKAIQDKDMQAINTLLDRVDGKVPQENLNKNENVEILISKTINGKSS